MASTYPAPGSSPSSSPVVSAEEIAFCAASAPTPAVSPKPTAAPPALPRVLNLEEDEDQHDGFYPMDPADETDLPASNPTPAASPKPSAAPPVLPRAIDLEEAKLHKATLLMPSKFQRNPSTTFLLSAKASASETIVPSPSRGTRCGVIYVM